MTRGETAVMFRPRTVGEAVQMLAAARRAGTAADLLGGGTDLVPALRAGERRPVALVALRRVAELRVLGSDTDQLTVGAGVTYTDLAGWAPASGLARVARAVGSVQIRNSGTVGGALGSARPNSDLLTFLTAADAEVLLASPTGPARMTWAQFRAHGIAADTVVTAVRLSRPAGPQCYLKIGGRQAAYPALVSCALLLDRDGASLTCAIGGVSEQPVRMGDAERYARAALESFSGARSSGAGSGGARSGRACSGGDRGSDRDGAVAEVAEVARRFGDLVRDEVSRLVPASSPAQAPAAPAGQRVSADYRRHAAGVLAVRALRRCLHALTVPSSGSGGAPDGPS